MAEYVYHCQYCDERWGGMYRVNDPVCRKCGSEGDYYVKTRAVVRDLDAYGYNAKEEPKRYGEK